MTIIQAQPFRLKASPQHLVSSQTHKFATIDWNPAAGIHRPRGFAMAGGGYAKAYLSEPIDAEELAQMVKNMPIVKNQIERRTNDHYNEQAATVA